MPVSIHISTSAMSLAGTRGPDFGMLPDFMRPTASRA